MDCYICFLFFDLDTHIQVHILYIFPSSYMSDIYIQFVIRLNIVKYIVIISCEAVYSFLFSLFILFVSNHQFIHAVFIFVMMHILDGDILIAARMRTFIRYRQYQRDANKRKRDRGLRVDVCTYACACIGGLVTGWFHVRACSHVGVSKIYRYIGRRKREKELQ